MAEERLIDANAQAPGRSSRRPSFIVTIDTEEDDAWARGRRPTTRNAASLERFQQLCERYEQRPTWLVTHEMLGSPVFRSFASDVVDRGKAEIGMHLHAWNSPPLAPLTVDDARTLPFLIEYGPRAMREKIHALTARIEDTLGTKMASHRAGRWAFDERYAEMLLEEGYAVDCSITPLVSWKATLGDPAGRGGSDYTRFPHDAYWLDLEDISRPGSSTLLEVPMTIVSLRSAATTGVASLVDRLPHPVSGEFRRVLDRVSPTAAWLRPNGRNGRLLPKVIERVREEGRGHAEFMLHSSELMPGGSPTFPDAASIERLYADVERLFECASGPFVGRTLSEFHGIVSSDGTTEAHADMPLT